MEDVYTYKSYSDIEFDEIDLDFQKQSEEIDFEDLEEWEKKVIIQVLVKDIEEEDRLEQKISRLREELAVLRRRGVIRAGQGGSAPTDRVCGRCRAELGRIINRGAICRGCNVRVCKSCREYTSRSGQDWICPVCQKNKEIAAASGQWVNEFIPNNGRKGGGKVYVPSTAELMKRNIRRSWTISNPTGTEGPMLTPRNQDQRNYHRPDIVPMEDDLHMLGRRAMEDDLQPLQLSSRPVVVAQIPPPPSRVQRFNNVPPPVGAAAVMPLNQPPLARNLPVRTQSLGVGDSGRYTAGRGGPPRFRPPPPPEDRRMFMRRDVAETSSDGEDLFDSGPGDFRSWDRRKFQESRFKAAEPRSKSGGDTQSLERKYNRSATETHSLDRRRRLPEVPSHSLPRPEKRSHSDNRGRGETSRGDDHWRSHSQGDVVDNNRRKLPNLPGSRDIREPTPDYDSSPPPSDSRLGRRNSDSGIPSEKQISVRRHASSIEKAKRPGLGLTSDDEMKGAAQRNSPLLKKFKSPTDASPPKPIRPTKTKTVVAPPKKKSDTARDGAVSAQSMNFSDLESTRIDFDENPPGGGHTVCLESDNNSDIVIDEKKIVPEGKDFKIVFISSESKSGSELNSSLECDPNLEAEEHNKGDFIDEMDWVSYKRKVHKTASDGKRGSKGSPRPGKSTEINHRNSPKTFMLDDFHYVGNLNGETRKTPMSPVVPKRVLGSPSRSRESPKRTADTSRRSVDSPRLRHPSNSPSIKTILTNATKDPNSIPPSPSMPKIHNIAIRREYELPPRPRSALSTTTLCSETSQDIEVQNILGNNKQTSSKFNPNESQEIMIDFDTTNSDSFDLNSSFDMSHIGKRMPNLKNRKEKLRVDSTRSSAERSLDEMSLHDQIVKNSKVQKGESTVEEFRNLVLAEIKSIQGNGLISRSLSESDLSELDGVSISRKEEMLKPEPSSGHPGNINIRLGQTQGTSKVTKKTPPVSQGPLDTKESVGEGRKTPLSKRASTPGAENKTMSVPAESSAGFSMKSPALVRKTVLNSGSTERQSSRPSTIENSPPPLLPPKTRKLQQLSSAAAPNQPEPGNQAVKSGSNQSEPVVQTPGQAVVSNNNTKSDSNGVTTAERTSIVKIDSFVDRDRPAGPQSSLGRSISSVGQDRNGHVVRKPVRRSKSQLPGSKYVANIQHGGLVTLVSLSDEKQYQLDPDLTPGFVNRTLNHNPQYSAFQGSNTLPRAGQLKKKPVTGAALDDSEIVITKKLTGAGSSVRIRIGGATRSPTQPAEAKSSRTEGSIKKIPTVREVHVTEPTVKKSGNSAADKKRRRYTLDQIEREEFKETDSELQISEPEEAVDDVNSDFDLNSLIEGVVDDDSETETLGDKTEISDKSLNLTDTKGKVVRYLEPLKDPEASVDGPEDFSEDELQSLAVNVGSLQNRQPSDTEEDFLDKGERDVQNLRKKESSPKEDSQDLKDSTPTPATPLLELPSTATPRATPQNTETSDFDSVSTTSASYLVNPSDLESISIDDAEVENMVNSTDIETAVDLRSRRDQERSRVSGQRTDQLRSQDLRRSGPPPPSAKISDQCEGQDETTTSARRTSNAAHVRAVENQPRSSAHPTHRNQHESSAAARNGADLGSNQVDSKQSGSEQKKKKKASVSELIARFENSRSSTPEQGCTPERNPTPERFDRGGSRPLSEKREFPPEDSVKGEKTHDADSGPVNPTKDGRKPADPAAEVSSENQKLTESESSKNPATSPESVSEVPEKDISTGAIPKKVKPREPAPAPAGDQISDGDLDRAELKGLREFTQKYLAENAGKLVNSNNSESRQPPAPEESVSDGELEEGEGMAPTIRRNSGGAYTSYVFISSEPSNDDVASVVSSNGSYTDPENRVTVNVKETQVSSPNTCVVSIQDGRTSNISIVSTESSELNSPSASPTLDEPPALPTKLKDHNELQQIVFATRDTFRDIGQRSRGGEEPVYLEEMNPRDEAEGGGLANYFTNTLESSFISRRGRPPVIRAAEKVRRQQGHFEYEDESRGMMIDYSDHHDYPEGDYVDDDYPEGGYREGSSTPVLDVGDEEYANHHRFQRERFAITEVGEGYSTHSENDEEYDINYGSGESGEEYMEMDQYMGHREYSMCQPVYDSEEYSHSEGEALSGDEFDREEELRGYNRAIDFTLHTILEESCEDSEPENKSLRDRKRHSDPSELEKYFFYGVGGGTAESNLQEDSECSDDHSENSEGFHLPEKSTKKESKQSAKENKMAAMMESKITSRLEDYFMSGFSVEKHQSLDGISDRGNTDDSGSVGSESDGQPSPEHRRKKISRPKFRSERLSDRGESGAENNSNVEDEVRADGHSSGEDNTAFVSGDGSFDTIKRKKNKGRKASDDRRSDGERDVRRLSSSDPQQKLIDSSGDLLPSPTMGRLPNQTIEVHHVDESKLDGKADGLRPDFQSKNDKLRDEMASKADKKTRDDLEMKSNKNSPSTSPPPVAGPVRKHKSRDSGFVGSNDDLLRNEGSNVVHTSSDETQGKNESSSEPETEPRKKRLEKVSEVSENTEDDCEKSAEPKLSHHGKMTVGGDGFPRKKSNESDISKDSDTVSLSRKDSFHQWSSDEETNIMMNRMRAFFKNMLANASKGKPVDSARNKPTQVLHFEDQLTRLMRTVPGINEQQVKEIVEYLSSEDTWSDSYDSSDYTDYTSSDLEGLAHSEEADMPDLDVVIQEPVRASNLASADTDDFQKETAIMYQKLMNSVAKMQQSSEEKKKESEKKSPPITAKILQHISSRLVTLMHEVSGSENSSVSSNISDSRQNLYNRDFNLVTSSPKVEKNRDIDMIKSDENENENNYTFDSLDSPKVLLGPNLGDPNQSNPFRFTKNTSKSVEILDLGPRRSSLDDKTIKLSMAKSTSTDLDVWRGVHRDVDQRRGSLPRGHLDNHGSNVSDPALDDERFSWKGSFESALAADSRTRLSIEAKRRSVEYECGSEIFSSGEQMDRNISRNGSKSSLVPSRSPSQSSRRSNKSAIHNSRSSTLSRIEKERDTTPTSDVKLYHQDSDSDSASGSVSSSVRSSISSRYGRRSSVPEQQILARLSEDSPPSSPQPRPLQSHKPGSGAARHSTNSLPRLGTSAIQKSKPNTSTLITPSQTNGQPTNIQTSVQGGVRSARYRPHGYKPPPVRKSSNTSVGSQRKSSVDSLGRITDDNDVSSKSGTPSPMVSRVGGASTSDLRDMRESSVPRSLREGSAKRELREGSVGSNDTNDGEEDRYRSNNLSSLGTRSESLASIYSQGEGRYGTVLVGGEVEFGYMYNQTTNSLDISIKQCRDLAPVDTKRNRSDPYVKVYLLPDRSKGGKRKTKVKKHTLNPVFDEILKFMMPMAELERRTMWVSVWHSDMFGRNDFLGEVMMPMAGQVFDDPSSKWYTLQDRTEPPEEESLANSRGDIILALKYVPSENSRKERKKKGTLMLLVKEAKNIPLTRGNTLPDPYCKCYLLPDRTGKHKQKTGVCRRTTSPRWEMTLTWEDLSLSEVAERSLEVSLWDHDRLGHHEQLGGVRLNLGTGKWGGRSAIWMDGQGREVTLWQQMLDRQNFWVEGSLPVRQLMDANRTEK